MAYEIRRGRLDEYRRWNYEKRYGGEGYTVAIACARCGQKLTIHNRELIESNGQIRTSVGCPRPSCDWLESNVKLIGYAEDGPPDLHT